MSKAFETALAAVAVPWRQKGKSRLIEAYSPGYGDSALFRPQDNGQMASK